MSYWDTEFILLSKPNYKAKDGTIKRGVEIKGKFYAPKNDMKPIDELKWKEIQSNKVRVFQLEDEPEIFYLIKIREDEYMIVFEDGYDQQTGKVEFANKQQVYDRYGVNAT